MNKNKSTFLTIVAKTAKLVGTNSVDAACVWFVHQPKVPDCMKKENKEK